MFSPIFLTKQDAHKKFGFFALGGLVLTIVLLVTFLWNGSFGLMVGPTAAELNQFPLSFIPNHGQREAAVLFEAPHRVGMLTFEQSRVRLSLPESNPTIELVGTAATAEVRGGRRQAGTANYYYGSDPEQWQTAVPMYEAIVYRQLYAGIDLTYDGSEGLLKGTYIVAPHADPVQIRWRYGSVAAVALDKQSGDLKIGLTDGGVLNEKAPIAFQEIDGRQRPVDVRYQLAGDEVSFVLGAYDVTRPLIIDPTLVYSSYLGGDSDDIIMDVATDEAGHIYVTGYSYSTSFAGGATHTNAGANDLFVTKINAAGTAVLYTTFLGGTGSDEGAAVAVNPSGNKVWVTGFTTSDNLPMMNAFQPDYGGGVEGMLVQLNNSGALVFSSYFGGDGYDAGEDIALDSRGDVHFTGTLWGGFIGKVDGQSYELIYANMVAGEAAVGYGIALDGDDNIYITGEVASETWPVVHAVQESCGRYDQYDCSRDAFVLKLSAAGDEILFNSYLGGSADNGGSGSDKGLAIAVDASGNIAVAGETLANDFPVVKAVQPQKVGGETFGDAFVTRLVKQGEGYQIAFSTYLGGEWSEAGNGVAMNTAGEIFVAGYTNSQDLPVKNAWQPVLGSGICFTTTTRYCYDGFASQFASNGTLLFSSYAGGRDDDLAEGVALDASGHLYVVGRTESGDFPVTAGGFQPERDRIREGFVLKIGLSTAVPPTATPPTVTPTTTTTSPTTTPPTATPPPVTPPPSNLTNKVYLPMLTR